MRKTPQKLKAVEKLLEEALVPEEEQPYEVPDNWAWVRLKLINTAKTRNIKPKNYPDEMFELYSVPNYVFDEPEYLLGEEIGSDKQLVKKDNILLCKINPRINRVWIVSENKGQHRQLASTEWIVIENSKGIYPQYLLNILKAPYFRSLLTSNVSGVGGSLTRARPKDVETYPIALPPLNEQKRIAEKVERLFDKIQRAKNLVNEENEFFDLRYESVLHQAFTGELSKDWRINNKKTLSKLDLYEIQKERESRYKLEQQNARVEKRKVKYNRPTFLGEVEEQYKVKLPVIPDEWEYAYLGNISEIVRGASPRPAGDPRYFGGNIPWITVAEITKDREVYLNNVSSYLTDEGADRSRFIEEGTLLLTNSGATLGVPKILNIGGCINDGSVAFVDISKTSKLYLYYFLLSQTKILRGLNQGAAQPNLNTDIVKHIVVPIPPYEEQLVIVDRLSKILTNINNEEEILRHFDKDIKRLQSAVLDKAFRGQLGTNDPTEENAIELLKDILQFE